MSWLLRHSGRFDNRGWLPIPQVLDFLRVSRDQLEEILRRMRVSDEWIRACQGHSVQVDTSDLLEEISMAAAPSALWHASFRRHRQSIAATGLRRGNSDLPRLGRRRAGLWICVDVRAALRARHVLWRSPNNVFLMGDVHQISSTLNPKPL